LERKVLVHDDHARLSAIGLLRTCVMRAVTRLTGGGIGCQLATHELRKWDALPSPMTQQLMRSCHRFDAAVESADKLGHGLGRLRARLTPSTAMTEKKRRKTGQI
jgi:hypothetical protein